MKKTYVILAMIVLIALAFSFCSKSSDPSPDFKYLGTWIGQNSYGYPIEIRVANVSNKQMVTYIELIAAAKWDSINYVASSTSGLTEITDSSFTYNIVEDYKASGTINGTFQSETSLSGDFTYTTSENTTFSGNYTVNKQ